MTTPRQEAYEALQAQISQQIQYHQAKAEEHQRKASIAFVVVILLMLALGVSLVELCFFLSAL